MRRSIRRRTAASLAVTLAAGSMLGAPEVHAAPKPDLIVTAQDLSLGGGGNVIIRPQTRRFTWSHRTKNVGNAVAPRSQTAVQFVAGAGGSITPRAARLPVPRLRAGRSHADNGSFRVDVDRSWEFGTYRTRICSDWRDDVNERNESNNCERLQPIYVIPFNLTGRVAGRMPMHTDGKVTVRWATNVNFDIATSTIGDDGVFDYRFDQGPVQYSVQGTDARGCTWAGSGTHQPSAGPDTIRLQFGPRHRYDAQNFIPSDFHFTVTQTCGGLPADIDFFPGSQMLTKWFDTNGWREFPDPGLTHLRGRFIDNVTTTRPITYTWNLEAGP